jgi:hypothetical protein
MSDQSDCGRYAHPIGGFTTNANQIDIKSRSAWLLSMRSGESPFLWCNGPDASPAVRLLLPAVAQPPAFHAQRHRLKGGDRGGREVDGTPEVTLVIHAEA